MFRGGDGEAAQCPHCGAPWEPTATGGCRYCEYQPTPAAAVPPTVPQPQQFVYVPTPGPVVTTGSRRGCGLVSVFVVLLVLLPLVITGIVVIMAARQTSSSLSGLGTAFTSPTISVPQVTVPNIGALSGSGSVSGALSGPVTGIVNASGGDPLACRTSAGRVTGLVFSGAAPAPPGGDLAVVAGLPAGLRGPGTYGVDQGLSLDVALTGPTTQTWKAGPGSAATLTIEPTGSVTVRFEGLPVAASVPGGDPLLAQPLSGTVTLTCPG
ncbi:MAG: hypothetical protein R2726_13660 [Acidimicrobiales bacterium]